MVVRKTTYLCHKKTNIPYFENKSIRISACTVRRITRAQSRRDRLGNLTLRPRTAVDLLI